MTQFDLKNFKRLPDGTYQKISNPQPRDLQPKVSVKVILQPTNIEFESGKAKPTKVKPVQHVYFSGMDIQDVYAQCEREGTIFIKGNVPSFKNSKQLFKNKKTGKNFITSSDLCKEYVESTEIHWRVFRGKFLEMIKEKQPPYKIQLFFVRDQHRQFDFGNVSEIIWDCMTGSAYYPKVKNKLVNAQRTKQRKEIAWIEDDNCDMVCPDYSAGYGYDPKMAGVIIKVL